MLACVIPRPERASAVLAKIWTSMVDDSRLLLDKARPGLGRFAVPALLLWLAIGLSLAALSWPLIEADGHSAIHHALYLASIVAAIFLIPRGFAIKLKLRGAEKRRGLRAPIRLRQKHRSP